MYPSSILPPVPLRPAASVTAAFTQAGALDYRSAAQYVSRLPYRRNRDASNVLAVHEEQCGTCSSKHAILRRLALEQGLDVSLVLGVFEMTSVNTPAVRPVLEKHGLSALPEAHCYLRTSANRVDATRDTGASTPRWLTLFCEEEITAEQIGEYKTRLHRNFLTRWIAQSGAAGSRNLNEIWEIREECIRALSLEWSRE